MAFSIDLNKDGSEDKNKEVKQPELSNTRRITKADVQSGEYISSGEFEEISDDSDTSITTDQISPSLAESIDVEEVIPEEKISQIDEAIKKAEEAKTFQDTKLRQNMLDSLFTSSDKKEDYFKNMANLMYREVHNKAKLFLKDWAVTNGFRQKWRNPFLKEFSAKHLTALSEFVPQVYSLSMINKETGEEIELAGFKPTPREAVIHGAKKLGFDTSSYKMKAYARFSAEVRRVLETEEKYLREQRDIHIYEEHRRQIEMRHYVNPFMRQKWIRDIEAELAKSTSRII